MNPSGPLQAELAAVFFRSPLKSPRLPSSRGAFNRIARPRGVKLAVENVGYQGTAIFTMNEFSSFLDPMDDNVGYLIDTGHAFIDHWDIPRLIRTVQDRLLALHLHDNAGSFDQHLAIGEGSIPWEPIWDSVRSTEMRFQLVLEKTRTCWRDDLPSAHPRENSLRGPFWAASTARTP